MLRKRVIDYSVKQNVTKMFTCVCSGGWLKGTAEFNVIRGCGNLTGVQFS